jgi:ClpP class serine protease
MKHLKQAYEFMSVYRNNKEKSMKIFKSMSLEEAKEFYEQLKEESKKAPSTILKIAMDDVWFFTDGLQRDY